MHPPTAIRTRFPGCSRRGRSWVVGVLATLTLLSTMTSGCFRYVEISDPAPRLPMDVRLRVTATDGQSELTDTDGYVTGRLIGWTEKSAILVWRSGPGLSDFNVRSHRDVEIARRRVLSVEMREMNLTKTALVVTGAVIVAAISWFRVLRGEPAGGSPRPTPPGDLAIVPIH